MKKITAFVSLSSLCAAAATAADNASRIPDPTPRDLNRVNVSYRVGYNVETTFSGLGGFAARSNPGPAAGGVNHQYDDGYVLLDSTHNGLGLTWFWGFDSATQVDGDNLLMSSTRGIGSGSARSGGDDLNHGIEATYARELGTYRRARWGVEGAFNFFNMGVSDRGTANADLEQTTDTYDLDGIIPFAPITSQIPYRGTSRGPGPLIADSPISRSVVIIPGGAVVTGERELDANLFGLRLGPYIEWPLSEKWTIGLNGGFALVIVDSDFDYDETVTPSGSSPFNVAGSGSETDLLPGAYIGANVSFQIAKSVTLMGGAQFQYAGEFSQEVSSKRVELDLSKSLFVTFGLNYSF